MKLISFLLADILLVLVKGQATDCDYDYVCDDTGSPGDLTMKDSASPLACYTACHDFKDPEDPAATCDFWTYYEELGRIKTFDGDNITESDGVDVKTRANGKPVCRRLTSCETRYPISDCGKMSRQKCASGPGSCEACDICPKLTYLPGATRAHWTCNVDLPYRMTNGMPPFSTCYTECPSSLWTNDGTTPGSVDNPVSVKAVCRSTCKDTTPGMEGVWEMTPDSATIGDGGAVPGPTEDSECLCDDLVLGENQVPAANGATSEEGARFYCNSDLIDNGDGPNTMDSTLKCQLYCNGHLGMDIKCNAGSWSEGIKTNEDIYCWGPPQECDYSHGVNMDVCTCTDGLSPPATDICLAGQGCDNGVCLNVCKESEDAITGADCFCESKTGGTTCAVGSTCNNWKCTTTNTTPMTTDTTPMTTATTSVTTDTTPMTTATTSVTTDTTTAA